MSDTAAALLGLTVAILFIAIWLAFARALPNVGLLANLIAVMSGMVLGLGMYVSARE